jgi:AraC-like DNA-binding protein
VRRSAAGRLGTLPNAVGTIARLAYARAKASGLDTRALVSKAHLTLPEINNTGLRLKVRDQITFLSLVADALRDDWFGFHLAQAFDLREFGFLYYVAASSETLGHALQRLVRYSAIANEGLSLTYLDGKNISLIFRYVGVSRHQDQHQIEFFMVFLIRLCRKLTGIQLVPRVRLSHHRSGRYLELTKFFGGNIEFGASVDDVSFAPIIRQMTVISADNYLNKLLITYCEEALARQATRRGPFHTIVENTIVPLLPHGDATLPAIARRLGLSPRTVARRLTAESLTFSDVLQNLRVNLAWRYLDDNDLSISQVAWLLGYQEVSSFTHAFRRWTGKTPRQARPNGLPIMRHSLHRNWPSKA